MGRGTHRRAKDCPCCCNTRWKEGLLRLRSPKTHGRVAKLLSRGIGALPPMFATADEILLQLLVGEDSRREFNSS